MLIKEVWPFLLPAVILQILLQILCIAEGARDKSLKPFHRTLYISSIAIFGLAAIAFHLFWAEKTPPKNSTPAGVERATLFSSKGIFFLLVIAYQVMGLHMLTENIGTEHYLLLITLLTLSFIIMSLYNLIPENRRHATEPLLPLLQLILSIPIQYLDTSGDNLFLSIIAGFSAINHATLPLARVYGVGALGAYLLGSTARTIFLSATTEISDLVRYFFVNTLVVLLAIVAFYTLKKQMITSVQLESALHTVNEQSKQLKELAVAQERNRIAAEMHDTVGHTLTAAVLSLEAGKLEQGKEQVRRGLLELRTSVRAVRAGSEVDFASALRQLLQEIIEDTDLDIQSVIESSVGLSPIKTGILLSAVKECATNAIKHGCASRADILIGEYQGQLHLTFTDNGVGAQASSFGSGLSIMRERIESVGGTLETDSMPGEGFTVNLLIPAAQCKEGL
jgi:signal transduction histidine kinase